MGRLDTYIGNWGGVRLLMDTGGHVGPPLRRIRKPSLLFVGAGHWPARVPGSHKGCPYKRGCRNLPPHPPPSWAPSPRGEGITGGWGHPPLRQGLGKNNGRTMCAPTREGAGNCLLICPSGRPAAEGSKYGQIFYYVTFCDVFSKNSAKAGENIKIF